MSKLSLDALRLRAEAVVSDDLLATISGGTENACHDGLTGNAEADTKKFLQENPPQPQPNTSFPTPPQPAPDKIIIPLGF